MKIQNLKKFYELEGKHEERDVDISTKIKEGYRFDYITREIEYVSKELRSDRVSVIDAGSGWGELSLSFAKKRHQVLSLDLAGSRFEIFKEEAKKLGIKLLQASLEEIPLRDLSVDLVVCSEVLEHLQNPINALNEFNRITKKYGFCIITVPYSEILENMVCVHCHKSFLPHGHLQSFDIKDLASLLQNCGYLVKKVKVINKALTSKLLGKQLINYRAAAIFDKLYPNERNKGWILMIAQKV